MLKQYASTINFCSGIIFIIPQSSPNWIIVSILQKIVKNQKSKATAGTHRISMEKTMRQNLFQVRFNSISTQPTERGTRIIRSHVMCKSWRSLAKMISPRWKGGNWVNLWRSTPSWSKAFILFILIPGTYSIVRTYMHKIIMIIIRKEKDIKKKRKKRTNVHLLGGHYTEELNLRCCVFPEYWWNFHVIHIFEVTCK